MVLVGVIARADGVDERMRKNGEQPIDDYLNVHFLAKTVYNGSSTFHSHGNKKQISDDNVKVRNSNSDITVR